MTSEVHRLPGIHRLLRAQTHRDRPAAILAGRRQRCAVSHCRAHRGDFIDEFKNFAGRFFNSDLMHLFAIKMLEGKCRMKCAVYRSAPTRPERAASSCDFYDLMMFKCAQRLCDDSVASTRKIQDGAEVVLHLVMLR